MGVVATEGPSGVGGKGRVAADAERPDVTRGGGGRDEERNSGCSIEEERAGPAHTETETDTGRMTVGYDLEKCAMGLSVRAVRAA